MMRNASCFIILFYVNYSLHFPNETRMPQVSQTLYLYSRVCLASKYPTLHTNAHQTLNSMAPKSYHKWCETTPI